jgi:hypothetical protein
MMMEVNEWKGSSSTKLERHIQEEEKVDKTVRH